MYFIFCIKNEILLDQLKKTNGIFLLANLVKNEKNEKLPVLIPQLTKKQLAHLKVGDQVPIALARQWRHYQIE